MEFTEVQPSLENHWRSIILFGRNVASYKFALGKSRQSEMEIRKKLLQEHAVDVMVIIGLTFFYTVTLPCTLWFLDKGNSDTDRKDKVLCSTCGSSSFPLSL
jgi:type I restriction enzyme M protein